MNKKKNNFWPRTLFLRFALIVIIPLVLSQLIYIYIFFERYWRRINVSFIDVLVDEVKIINNEFDSKIPLVDKDEVIKNIKSFSNLDLYFLPFHKTLVIEDILKDIDENRYFLPKSQFKKKLLSLNIDSEIFLGEDLKKYIFYIKKHDGFLAIEINKKRVVPLNIDLLLFWSLISSLLLTVISFIFIKNQIRSINSLTQAMQDFTLLEKDNEDFIPKGAKEIREIGFAFLKMQKEIKQFVNSRTILLAEISHDLRTPLTRIKLETEFIDDEDSRENIKKDLEEMEKMINEYLLFAKGENSDSLQEVVISEFFKNIVDDYKRGGYKNITYKLNLSTKRIILKADLFKRAINNVINNSLKYAKKIEVSLKSNESFLNIIVEDNGPGVSKEMYNKITQPFFKMEDIDKNIGLGLAITKNIVYLHKGKISFNQSKNLGGLEVNISIPIIY